MHKRLVLYLFVLSLTFFTNVNGAESEGMPQLNPEFWVSQIFWLILTFGSLFIILSKFVLPKISNNLEMRKSQILENIETAEKQKIESENKIKEYETLINNSKNEAKNYFNEARKTALTPIVFSNENNIAYLSHCYALAYISSKELSEITHAKIILDEMKERGLSWPINLQEFEQLNKTIVH